MATDIAELGASVRHGGSPSEEAPSRQHSEVHRQDVAGHCLRRESAKIVTHFARVFLLVTAAALLFAQTQAKPLKSLPLNLAINRDRLLYVNGERIDTLKQPSVSDGLKAGRRRSIRATTAIPKQWYLVVRPGTKLKAIEKAAGVKLGHYIPSNAYIIVADRATAERAGDVPGVLWVGSRPVRHKLSPNLESLLNRTDTLRSESRVDADDDRELWTAQSLIVMLIPAHQRGESHEPHFVDAKTPSAPNFNRVPAPTEDIAYLWQKNMAGEKIKVDVSIISEDRLLVKVREQRSLKKAIEWIGDRAEAVWIESRPVYKPLNAAATKMIVEGDGDEVRQMETDNIIIREKALNGSGQIIGIADTGIDWDNCFFWESAQSLDYTERGRQPPFNFADSTRRKLIGYNWYDDCNICDRCPVDVPDDDFQFASANGLLEAGQNWQKRFPEVRSDSAIAPRSYDSAGGSVRYDLKAFTSDVASQYLAQGAGAFDVPADIQVFILRRDDLENFDLQNPDYSQCLNDCTVIGNHLVVEQEELGAANGGYGVIIANKGKNGALFHIWILGTINFMTANKPCGDDGDDRQGHGTHIAGSAAGSAEAPASQAAAQQEAAKQNGMAPASQIYFSDIMQNADPNCTFPDRVCNRVNEVSPPLDLYSKLFAPAYDNGARIHLDSWGCAASGDERAAFCNEYTTDARDMDKFMFDKQDFLIVTAAGDTGDEDKEATVASPGTCKNCLTVGATNLWNERYREAAQFRDPMADVCAACSFPDFCSQSDFIDGIAMNSSNRFDAIDALPTCCNDTLHTAYTASDELLGPNQLWALHLPNMSLIDTTINNFIRDTYRWPFDGASIHYEFEAEFDLFGPTSGVGERPRIQVMVLDRDAFTEFFENGVEDCISSGGVQPCRPNPCTTNQDEQGSGTETCLSRAGNEYEPLSCPNQVVYGDLSLADPFCHAGPCKYAATEGGPVQWDQNCPAGQVPCCNDAFLLHHCINTDCADLATKISGIVRHSDTLKWSRAQKGYGIVVRNMNAQPIRITGSVEIHPRQYPCSLQDCCQTADSKCCSRSFTRSFAVGNACGGQACPAPGTFTPGDCEAFEKGILPKWSSRGPARSNHLSNLGEKRYKPDVVAPGVMIVSANSDGNPRTNGAAEEFEVQCDLPSQTTTDDKNCDVLSADFYRSTTSVGVRDGSSVAAALVAGAAAVIRQYLVDGFYPEGARNDSNTLFDRPSAALVKAMIINSARSVNGVVDVYTWQFEPFCNPLNTTCPEWVQPPPTVSTVPLGPSPNYFEGYGRPQLKQVLWFSESSFSLFLNESTLSEEGFMMAYYFPILSASDSEPLVVTLAYTDPPGTPGAGRLLVNDLDLVVQLSERKTIFEPNLGVSRVRDQFVTNYGNGGNGFDRFNTVEQVTITSATPTEVTIAVVAHRISQVASPNGQKFAVVVTGNLRPHYATWNQSREEVLGLVGETGDPDAYDAGTSDGFNTMDVFKTGFIDRDDVELRLDSVSDRATAASMITDVDRDDDNLISAEEWRRLVKALRSGSRAPREPNYYFGEADASILQSAQSIFPNTTISAAPSRWMCLSLPFIAFLSLCSVVLPTNLS